MQFLAEENIEKIFGCELIIDEKSACIKNTLEETRDTLIKPCYNSENFEYNIENTSNFSNEDKTIFESFSVTNIAIIHHRHYMSINKTIAINSFQPSMIQKKSYIASAIELHYIDLIASMKGSTIAGVCECIFWTLNKANIFCLFNGITNQKETI